MTDSTSARPVSTSPSPADIQNFIHAAELGDAETVGNFLRRWPQHIDVKNDKTWTALMYAAGSGQGKIVALLLQQGANPVVVDRFDRTARWFASRNFHLEVVALLQESMKRSS
jgi:NAD+ diphosphatase